MCQGKVNKLERPFSENVLELFIKFRKQLKTVILDFCFEFFYRHFFVNSLFKIKTNLGRSRDVKPRANSW